MSDALDLRQDFVAVVFDKAPSELVSADPRGELAGSAPLLDNGSETSQDVVDSLHTVSVVQGAQLVDVEKDEGGPIVCGELRKRTAEFAGVQQAGQIIHLANGRAEARAQAGRGPAAKTRTARGERKRLALIPARAESPRPPLRMQGLAAREHRHELLNLARPSFGSLHRLDAMQDRIAILAREPLEHRLGVRLGRKRSRQVGRHVRPRGARISHLPSALGLRTLNFGDPGRLHPALADQPLREHRVPLRPAAPRPPRRETLEVRSFIAAANLAINPSEADRFLESLVVAEARRRGRALFREHEHYAGVIGMVVSEPIAPRPDVRDDQFPKLTADSVGLATM